MKSGLVVLVTFVCFAGCFCRAQEQKPPTSAVDKKDTRVEPTHWGNVWGRVYDAGSGAPIKDASVSVETEEGFLEKGRSAGKTDELGGYRVQSILGRISHNFDVGRALLSSPLGMLFGTANNTTKRIDASRVAIRVQAPGYKTFEGVLVARRADARAFRIEMEPVLMVPEADQGASVAANGWAAVRIIDTLAQPAVAHKGDKIKLVAMVRAFGSNPAKNIEIAAVSRLWKGERRLQVAKEQPDGKGIRFECEYKVTGKEKHRAESVIFYIRRSVLDFSPRRWASLAIVQVADTPDEDEKAKTRSEAWTLMRDGRFAEATPLLKSLAGTEKPATCDLELLAFAAERSSDYNAAADAWLAMEGRTFAELSQEVAQCARALYLGKRYADAADVVNVALKASKPKDWPKKVQPMAVGYLGLSYLKLGKIEAAEKLNEDLLAWPSSGLSQSVIEFRNALRLAVVEKAHAADPGSAAALADYGRALLDLGRYEEAVAKLKESLDIDGNQVAIRRDIAWASLQMHGEPPNAQDLEAAVAEARASLNLDSDKLKSKDFFSWDKYGVLLFALADQQAAAGSADAAKTYDEAILALREALTLGRVGARTNAGTYNYAFGYTSGSEVAISGFAYPQANSSYVLLDSLKKLRKDPANYLAQFNEAAALLDLGQTTLADQAVTRLLNAKPDFAEGVFLAALVAVQLGDSEKANALLNRTLELNPLHPRANLVLAQLFARDGDMAASAERLAEHAKHYGDND